MKTVKVNNDNSNCFNHNNFAYSKTILSQNGYIVKEKLDNCQNVTRSFKFTVWSS